MAEVDYHPASFVDPDSGHNIRGRHAGGLSHGDGGLDKPAWRQLLEVTERHKEITPARAALNTSLTVDEAERPLSELAWKAHLDVRLEGSKLVYSL